MVMDSDIDQLQALTCVKCGAALPAEAATGEMVTCGYCGTAFKLPTAHSGGVSISGGSITVGGDVIGGSKRVIVTSEAPSAATVWDEPDTDDDEGVSIEGDGIQVFGDVIGGSVMQIVQAPPMVKAEPAAAVQVELALDSAVDETSATSEVAVGLVKPTVPEVALAPAPKLGWWEKVKRLFSN
jgi:hypothetical protein